MAKKSSKKIKEYIEDAPKDLTEHIFHGLILDEKQRHFRDCIWSDDYDIIFCDARAGTGKTLIALATANLLYKYNEKYDGIIYVVAPTQEQKIGYLPGDIDDKVSPYISPIKDALLKININPDDVIIQCAQNAEELKEKDHYINCISHIYLRGCNFDNKIVIIEEAQNMYLDELKKTLTRVNPTCKIIVIGHTGQCDLYKNPNRSGFGIYKRWYSTRQRSAICELTEVYRSWVAKYADDLDTDALCEYLNEHKDINVNDIDLDKFLMK